MSPIPLKKISALVKGPEEANDCSPLINPAGTPGILNIIGQGAGPPAYATKKKFQFF